jgi:hypothetical protein
MWSETTRSIMLSRSPPDPSADSRMRYRFLGGVPILSVNRGFVVAPQSAIDEPVDAAQLGLRVIQADGRTGHQSSRRTGRC